MSFNTSLNVIDEEEEATSDGDGKLVYSDDELQEVEYVQIQSPDEAKLLQFAHELLENFDTLGVCPVTNLDYDEDVYMRLIMSGFNLVNKHRTLLAEGKDNNLKSARLKEDNVKLEKQLDTLKHTISKKDDLIESINKKVTLKNIECDALYEKVAELQRELNHFKKLLCSKQNEWEHKVKQLQIESDSLKNVAERSAGSFQSKDLLTANIIKKYKTNEENYQGIIKKLQNNNQDLLRHLVYLMDSSETDDMP